MKNYELIVFDWDGTLYDSVAMIVNAVQYIAKEMNMPIPTEEQSRNVIGLSFDIAVEQLFPGITMEQKAEYIKTYRHWQKHREQAKPQLFKGSQEVLQTLKDQQYLLAIATGKSRRNFDVDLVELGLTEMFDATRCGDEGLSKPHPDMLLHVMDTLGVEPAKTLMVGDTEYDMAMAKSAGAYAAAVTYGVHELDALLKHEPRHVVHSIQDVLKCATEATSL